MERDILYLAVIAALVGIFGFSHLKSYLTTVSQKRDEALAAQNALASEVRELRTALVEARAIPKYLEGLEKIAGAWVMEVSKLREAVERFSSLVVAKPQEDESSFTAYDAAKADLAYRRAQYEAEGMTAENAEARALADDAARLYGNPIE